MGLFSKSRKDKKDAASQNAAESLPRESDKPEASADSLAKEPHGPRDFSEIMAEDMSNYADFGVFLVPKIPGIAVHPDNPLSENSFSALTVQVGKAAVELIAVAAPKSTGLWDDLRLDIRGETTRQGNTCEERKGTFGTELWVQMAAQAPNGQRGHINIRYCGVDGPNWFLRMVFNGAISPDDSDMQALEEVLGKLVVVRGDKPMTPRTIIPVVLPDDLVRQLSALQAQIEED